MSTKINLTREQKRAVAAALLAQAGNMAEFWDGLGPDGVPRDDGVRYLAQLLRGLPGDAWDTRLPDPNT